MSPHSQAISFNTDNLVSFNVTYAGQGFNDQLLTELSEVIPLKYEKELQAFFETLINQSFLDLPDILLVEIDADEKCFSFIENLKKQPVLQRIIIILIAPYKSKEWEARAISLKVHDYYSLPFLTNHLKERIRFLVKSRLLKPAFKKTEPSSSVLYSEYQMPRGKRVFDVVASFTLLVLLSPVYLIIAIFISLESSGPVIYSSKRVGTGYKVFNFYKFRSMGVNADSQLQHLSSLNQYNNNDTVRSVYIKIANDPRVTKVGKFLRNTSFDELPQLFNILKGDMSFVGNRPLPLYEAERLTSDQWSMRFHSPAGLTGLWQVSKRGKKNMSENERKELDNFYAKKYSFWMDFKILISTIPALIQQEKV